MDGIDNEYHIISVLYKIIPITSYMSDSTLHSNIFYDIEKVFTRICDLGQVA